MARWYVLALAGVAFAQSPQAGRGVNFYSCQKEAALGAELAREFRQTSTPLAGDTVREYVDRVGARIAARMPAGCDTNPYHFEVVTEDTVTHEPVALPGGFVFVPAALITAARSEAEFAGMLAHAMAHIAYRHATQQATRGQLANAASVPLIDPSGYAIRQGAETALPLSMAKLHRQLELAADRAAAQAMSAAGYDPEALVRYIERNQPHTQPSLWSPLPTETERVDTLREAISALGGAPLLPDYGLAPIQRQVLLLTPEPPRPVRRAPSLVHH